MKAKYLVLAALVAAFGATAAETPTSSTTTTTTSSSSTTTVSGSSKPGKIIGGIELRPSYLTTQGEYHAENWVQGGYQFGNGVSLSYRQEFRNNFHDVGRRDNSFDLSADDGFFRGKFGDIWKNGAHSFYYENRVYIPTNHVRRELGMVTAIRNYARYKYNVSKSVQLSLEEMPIVHFYSQNGGRNPNTGRLDANPWFENRVSLAAEWTILKDLKLFFPLVLRQTRFREFARGAKNNDVWVHRLYIWPELVFAVNSQINLGLAYQSGDLIAPDFSKSAIDQGFKTGMAQLILSASL